MTTVGLTDAEQEAIRATGELFRCFDALPQLHPADREEFAFHVPALARIVGMRAARAHPELVKNRSGTPI